MVQNNVFSNSISVKVDRWECVHEGFCAMICHLDLEEKEIPPQARLKLVILLYGNGLDYKDSAVLDTLFCPGVHT